MGLNRVCLLAVPSQACSFCRNLVAREADQQRSSKGPKVGVVFCVRGALVQSYFRVPG